MPDDTSPRRAGGRAAAERVRLCLDFANTLHWHASDRPHETLHGYDDLLAWARAQRAVAREPADALSRHARREPAAARAAFRRALALREAIYRIFVARIDGAAPPRGDVQRLNDELRRALPHYRVEFGAGGAAWTLAATGNQLDLPLWPIVQSAAELLLTEALRDRVGRCADPGGCGWLFLDLSKNRSRRWCSIADCGNRAKQRRLQARLKRSQEGRKSRGH